MNDREVARRRSTRLSGYDYSLSRAYFVTICTAGRECTLGEVSDLRCLESEAGRIVREVWLSLPKRFPTLTLDAFVVMPNHVHAIIVLGSAGAASSAPTVDRTRRCRRS